MYIGRKLLSNSLGLLLICFLTISCQKSPELILTKVSGSLVDENNKPITNGIFQITAKRYKINLTLKYRYSEEILINNLGQFSHEANIQKESITLLSLNLSQFSNFYEWNKCIQILDDGSEKVIADQIELRPGDDLNLRLKLIKKM